MFDYDKMSLSRTEKLEKLKALREANKNLNNKNIEETLDDLDKYLEKYDIDIPINENKKKESKIKNLIDKFNKIH